MHRRNARWAGALAVLTAALVAALGTATAQASFLGGGLGPSFLKIQGGVALAYHANMDAAQQTASGIPGEPGATGTASLSLDASAGTICYNISWSGIPDAVAFGHIHQGAAGQPENVSFTVNLFGPVTSGATSPQSGCVLAPGQIQAIEADPSLYMVTLHSKNFPAGALRGQIQPG